MINAMEIYSNGIIGFLFALFIFLILYGLDTKSYQKGGKKKIRGKRVSTGIHGLDSLTEGGFVDGSINLVSGGTGTGKTIFGLQFCYEGLKEGDNFVYMSFEDKKEELIEDAKNLGLDFKDVEKNKSEKNYYRFLDHAEH